MARIRIVETRLMRAGDLLPNPKNWRTHPKVQRDALTALLEDIGYVSALIARETPDGVVLLDGHLRAGITPDDLVPVAITDLDDDEENTVLATLDPISYMAGTDRERLDELLAEVSTDNEAVQALLDSLAATEVDAAAEWAGMPEFQQEDQGAWKSLTVHFKSPEDYEAFQQLLGGNITTDKGSNELTERTRSFWYPATEVVHMGEMQYAS